MKSLNEMISVQYDYLKESREKCKFVATITSMNIIMSFIPNNIPL